jgi:carbamoyltransferase
MGDGGLAVGAALHVQDHAPCALGTALLGPCPTEAAMREAAEGSGLPFEASADPDAALVEAVGQGQPAVRYEGAMEFGPRALGHRTVLAPVDDPGITDPLNAALKREEFMPFAPLLRHEDGAASFEHYDVAQAATRYMTVALQATPWFAERCPAAVHVDGTARPQTVRADEDAALHDLVARIAERTGRPAVINTSFNLHEEPIVNTPAEAVRAFVQSGLPVMRLGPYVLRNPASAWKPRAS